MKITYKIAGVIALILFIGGIFITAFLLYKLPDDLVKGTVAIGTEEVSQLQSVLNNINLFIGVTLFSGLLSTIFLLVSNGENGNEDYTFNESSGKKKDNSRVQQEVEDFDLKEEHLEVFKNIVKEEKDIATAGTKILSSLCEKLEASQAALYQRINKGNKRSLQLFASYAFILPESDTLTFEFGEGLVGQAAKEGKSVNIKSVPDGYIRIFSGLGNSTPNYLLLIPIKDNDTIYGVAEIASFRAFSNKDQKLAEEIFSLLSPKLAKQKSTGKIEAQNN